MDDPTAERPPRELQDRTPKAWYSSDLEQEFHWLRTDCDPHQRGHRLEDLLERAFRRAHFQVEHNPSMATDRQTDFAVLSRDRRYLVEAKWWNKPADVGVVDDIRTRLGSTEATVVGVLMSVSGINPKAAERIVNRREYGTVLVFDEIDIVHVMKDPHELVRLLRVKHDALVSRGQVHLGAEHQRSKPLATSLPQREFPQPSYTLRTLDGKEVPWVSGAGGFTSTVFCLELPDVDWVPAAGSGVSLDMPISAWDQAELLKRLAMLNDLGWMSGASYWSFQQSGRNWYGTGARSFLEALNRWEDRTNELADPHHSEEFVYFDTLDGDGFYTISGNLSAGAERRLYRCNASFQLVGMPIDPGPLQQLYERFDVPRRGFFRPLVERSVARQRLASTTPLEVLGYLVESADVRRDEEDWVVGVVVTNPYYQTGLQRPEGWPRDLDESGVLVCELLSHHPLAEPRERYELWSVELARTSDAHALRVIAEWWPAEGSPLANQAEQGGFFGAARSSPSVVEVIDLRDQEEGR